MIIKHNNNLYNLEGWKTIKLEEGYCVITFANIIKYDDENYENYEINIELVEEYYLYDFQREHEDYDHKDIRQVRYRADDIIYNMIINEIIRDTQLIDLDKMVDVPKILEKANKQFIKDFNIADDNSN